MKNKLKKLLCTTVLIASLTGCGSKGIAGTWYYISDTGYEYTMLFEKDGGCMDVYSGPTSADAISYKIRENGALTLEMEWDGPVTFDRVDTPEKADYDNYYLSPNGKKLIFRGHEWTKK